ncbi:MAG: hypothetical protein M3O36_19765 [Myxococcota bacterium]|nr:hypothetical protein [Myxococcota bacterium]
MKPRAVTGIGVVSALGVGRAAFFEAMRAGVFSGAGGPVSPGRRTPAHAVTAQAGVPGFDAAKHLGEKGLRSLDRLTKLLIVAARLALQDAGLKLEGAWTAGRPDRAGIVTSNAYGSLEVITELDRVAILEDARYINPSRFPLTVSNSAAGYASIWEELRAINVSVSDGNCGGLDAFACADVFLEQARADVLLVGGVEALSEALAVAFDRLAAADRGNERVILGEGAALLALETPGAARDRCANVICEVTGYGTAFSPPEREVSFVYASAPALERAITTALADAGIVRGGQPEIDVVVSGLSGLNEFDDAELLAIERTAGEQACVVAPKRALGETFGAGGALGVVAAIAYLCEGARSHVVRGTLRAQPRRALITSMGYYGNASALVVEAR